MFQFFNKWVSKQREVRVSGHEKWVACLMAHPNGELVLSSGHDSTVRLFSSVTGRCLTVFEGHHGTVWNLTFADQDTFLSASDDKTLKVWDIPSRSLKNVVEFEEYVWCVAKIGDGIFASGLSSGTLHTHVKEGDKITTSEGFQAHNKGINRIASWKDRFGTASLDTTAKIWDVNTFKCLATLTGHKETCSVIAMSETYIATGSKDGTIIVYNASNFAMIRRITSHILGSYIRCVHFVGSEEHLLSTGDDKTIRLHNSSTAALLWTKHSAEPATCSTVLKGGRLATGFASGDTVIYGTPTEIAPHILPLNAYLSVQSSVRAHPLRDALMSCVSGYSCPRDHCVNLINYNACRVSYDEWCSAHRILMLAVEDGDILGDTEFNNEHNWWYDNLYIAVRDIELIAPEYSRLKSYLTEAKERRVLESTEAVLTALHVTKDVRKNTVMMEKAGILILERVLRMEYQLEHLRKAYNRYVTHQRKSQLIGIALQVIPIAGGAVAGALSAGSEIVKGLSVKDITDYAMGIGTNFAQSQVDGVGDHILRQAAETISPSSIGCMDICHRKKLEEALRFCGIDINTIHQLFLLRVTDNNENLLSHVERTADQAELCDTFDCAEDFNVSGSVKSAESCKDDGEAQKETFNFSSYQSYEDSIRNGTGISEECGPCPFVGEPGRHDKQDQNHPFDESNCSGHFDNNEIGVANLKQVEISARVVAALSQERIAQLWAAYACRFDVGDQEKFCELAKSLSRTLVESEIYGSELVDRRLLSIVEIMQLVEDGLQKRDKEVTHGQRARMKRFLLEVSSDTCLCNNTSKVNGLS